MLYVAGSLTLDLMDELLPAHFGLKDASPYNILFRGYRPVFVDLLSIERRAPNDPTWLGFSQFSRNFIRPLLLNKHFGIGLDQVFRVLRDGLQPEQVYRLSSLWQKLRPPFLTQVTLPTILSRLAHARLQKIYQPHRTASAKQSQFIIRRQLKGLRRKLVTLKPRPGRTSAWSKYSNLDHSQKHLPIKERFVKEAMDERPPLKVLDVGCNVGYFSKIAARAGSAVVAIDRDPSVVDEVWRDAAANKLNILPLVIDLTRPVPGLGWRNQECSGFLDRAIGTFDYVLMLAVIHHMLVTERIPLTEIMRLASELTTDTLVIEYIPPDDPMFSLIARGNDCLYRYLTREYFETVSRKYFLIEKSQQVGASQRWLYRMRRARVA
jgi:SAM-dependent methyltransferase